MYIQVTSYAYSPEWQHTLSRLYASGVARIFSSGGTGPLIFRGATDFPLSVCFTLTMIFFFFFLGGGGGTGNLCVCTCHHAAPAPPPPHVTMFLYAFLLPSYADDKVHSLPSAEAGQSLNIAMKCKHEFDN